MRNVLVALFWLWVLVSLSVYAVRIWRRVNRRSTGAAAPVVPDAPSTPLAPAPVAPPAPPLAAPEAPAAPVDPVASARSGLFTPAPRRAPAIDGDSRAVARDRPTVADALAGIEMPAGLTPVVSNQPFVDPYRVAFTTTTATPEQVGAALGDELERLGFAVASVSDHEVEASREGTRVRATIHVDPTTLTVAGAPVITHPVPGTVAVTFET